MSKSHLGLLAGIMAAMGAGKKLAASSRELHRKPRPPGKARVAVKPKAKKAVKSKGKGRAAAAHGGYDNESVTFGHGKHRGVKPNFVRKVRQAASEPNYYDFTGTDKFTATSGVCCYWTSPMLYQQSDVQAMAAKIPNVGGTGTPYSQYKYTIDNASLQCQLVNASNSQAVLKVYECQCRFDLPTNASFPFAYSYLVQGFTDAGLGTAVGLTAINGSPFQSPAFCEHFKITKVRVLKFNPGEQKIVRLNDKSPLNINMNRYYGATTQLIEGVARRSKFLLFQLYGQVGTDSANVSHIGTMPVVCNTIYTQRYTYFWTADPQTSTTVGVSFTQNGDQVAQTVLTTPSIIEEMTGAAVAGVTD
nr:MAG: capsid protein [Cressdnaviricota sp.]